MPIWCVVKIIILYFVPLQKMAYINYHKKVLKNGLKVIVHTDVSSPLVAVSLLYNVGSRNEHPDKTGYAHLFEHLMFGGSKNAPSYDDPIQIAGGESNAFTNSDITNFYCTIPAQNIESVLWLEADRMQYLNLTNKILKREKDVVIEEFKETCINQPYGDLWHLLSDLTYKTHPYKWPTIGIDTSHIKNASLEDVTDFYNTYYNPNNAILVLTGNIQMYRGFYLSEQYFGEIPNHAFPKSEIPKELPQHEMRRIQYKREVPANVLYLAFQMCNRTHSDYPIIDLLSDVLAGGKSSFFYQRLLKQRRICNSIDAYITGTFDEGLFVVEARPAVGISVSELEDAIWAELDSVSKIPVKESILIKLKNKIENSIEFGGTNIMHKAMNLAYFEWIGKPELINTEYELYNSITKEDIQRVANNVLRKDNCSVLEYLKLDEK